MTKKKMDTEKRRFFCRITFLRDFRDFLLKGNAMTLAIGVIIGAAMGQLVNSLVYDIFGPIIGLATHADFSRMSITLSEELEIRYGAFLTQLITFLITAFVVFLIIKLMGRMRKIKAFCKNEEQTEKVCPYCKSDIDITATRCKYCTSEL